ncbi:hypothetical protein ACSJLP_27480 [Gordonia rhizosphera NBRC 16068]
MSDFDSIAVESKWCELYRLLLAPGTVAYALAPTARSNKPIKVNSGDAGALMSEAERAGAGHAAWAVVAPLRADLLVLDIDECADVVWPTLRDAAADVGAGVAHCAASGRPDCLHVALACPTDLAMQYLLRLVEDLRRRHGPALSETAGIDVRGRKPIRLPGSVSLKGHAPCVAVDEHTLAPITAIAAAHRAAAALEELPHTERVPRPTIAAPRLDDHAAAEDEASGLQWEAPRAWRARTPLSAEDWHVLNDLGADRSLAATDGAWRLWRHGLRSFAAARWWYERLPCFTKFRDRDLEAHRKRGGRGPMRWDACQSHWNSIVRRARAHQPEIPVADQAVIDAVLEELTWWPEADLAATAAALIYHRFADGHGIHARPIARRDLNTLMHFSDGTASRTLGELARRGVLTLVERWPANNPRRANLYTLTVPPRIYRGDRAHDVTSPPARTSLPHPLWGQVGHKIRRTWLQLTSLGQAVSTKALARTTGTPAGDHSHGLLQHLHTLETLGLVTRSGRGRGTLWQAAPGSTLDVAARACGATDRSRQISARVVAERRCWHSETRSEQARSKRGLQILRERLTHSDATATVLPFPDARRSSRHTSRHRRRVPQQDGP